MEKCKYCYLRDAKPCYECGACAKGDDHFRPVKRLTKKCQAFAEDRKINPQECIYFGEPADSPECTFCDGTLKKYITT